MEESKSVSIFIVRAADKLADAVNKLVKAGVLSARSEAADALLEYANVRFGGRNPIGDLEKYMDGTVKPPSRLTNGRRLCRRPRQGLKARLSILVPGAKRLKTRLF